MIIQGTASSSSFSYAVLQVQKCSNTSTDISCAPQEVINKVLSAGFVGVFVSDRMLDQSKIGNPFKAISKSTITTYSILTQKYLAYYFRHSLVETTENFFYYLPKLFQHNVLQFENLVESSTQATDINKDILLVNIFLDDRKITYFRTYDNILNIFGAIGGFFDILVFSAGLLMLPLAKLSQNISLVNQIFSFEMNQNLENLKNTSVSPDFQKRDIQRKQSIKSSLKMIENQKSSVDISAKKIDLMTKNLRRFLNQKEKKFRLIGWEKLTIFCGGVKKKQIEFGIDKIRNKLDIGFIVRKLIEIEKLKMIFFTNDQLKLFEYIPKPTIPLNLDVQDESETINNIYFSEEIPFKIRVQKALDAYKNSRNNPDSISQKLIALMDQEIKEAFELAFGYFNFILFYLENEIDKRNSNREFNIFEEIDRTIERQFPIEK